MKTRQIAVCVILTLELRRNFLSLNLNYTALKNKPWPGDRLQHHGILEIYCKYIGVLDEINFSMIKQTSRLQKLVVFIKNMNGNVSCLHVNV